MSGETLYTIACEMLQRTSVFDKRLDEIKYSSNSTDCGEVRFLDLVRKCTKKYDHRFRGKSEANLLRAYSSIMCAMIEYIEDFPATFSFKQRTKRNFKIWLEKIRKDYHLGNQKLPDELNPNKESDTAIALLKLLHSREGVTYDDIHQELEIGVRAIQKDLVKLSPAMYTGNGEVYAPFRLGGQKLQAEIELVERTKKAGEKRFYTRNTVHPLVLQENVMQLATLLKSLCHQYYDYEDDISVTIAVDIWSQLSSYAQSKIENYFTYGDQDFAAFINILKDECPDDHVCAYHTERQMIRDIEMPIDQSLEYLAKADGRSGILVFFDGTERQLKQISKIQGPGESITYKAIDSDNDVFEFTKEQVLEVVLK